MSHPLPTIVFFAGAFADPSCFDNLASHLHEAGYPTSNAHVQSLNPSSPNDVSTSSDALNAREEYLLPLIEQGKDVIVLAHSYGGVVAGQAARGLSKSSRTSQKQPGGIVGLLYLVGNIVGEGESLLQAVGGAYPPFIKQNHPSQGLAVISPVMETLYNDADLSLAPTLEAGMIPHALAAFESSATAPAWLEPEFDGRRAYIRTLNDQCNPSFLQDIWLEKSGVKWDIVDLESSHCPFLTRTKETAELVVGAVGKWR